MARTLTTAEMRHWTAWKQAVDTVSGEVASAITTATGLSVPDFSILTRVAEARTPLRQQGIADALGWSRSRLSRQLGRMEQRGLVERSAGTSSTVVLPTASGRALAATARKAHADAVRRSLIGTVPAADAEVFWRVLERLGDHRPG